MQLPLRLKNNALRLSLRMFPLSKMGFAQRAKSVLMRGLEQRFRSWSYRVKPEAR